MFEVVAVTNGLFVCIVVKTLEDVCMLRDKLDRSADWQFKSWKEVKAVDFENAWELLEAYREEWA